MRAFTRFPPKTVRTPRTALAPDPFFLFRSLDRSSCIVPSGRVRFLRWFFPFPFQQVFSLPPPLWAAPTFHNVCTFRENTMLCPRPESQPGFVDGCSFPPPLPAVFFPISELGSDTWYNLLGSPALQARSRRAGLFRSPAGLPLIAPQHNSLHSKLKADRPRPFPHGPSPRGRLTHLCAV